MKMLWQEYVFRQGSAVYQLWDEAFIGEPIDLLYISARAFDRRSNLVLKEFVTNCATTRVNVESADLILLSFPDYALSDELANETEANASDLKETFSHLSTHHSLKEVVVSVSQHVDSTTDDQVSAAVALRSAIQEVVNSIGDHTDIVLDISSLPRVAYLGLLTGLLERIIKDKDLPDALFSSAINFYVFVGEDAMLDSNILSEDPSSEVTLVPGFASTLHSESVKDWPLVWFPLLGEGRVSQLQRVMVSHINDLAEICPVLPHPCKDARRADRLLIEYRTPLFDARKTPTSNIMYVHESQPFETYRQLLGAMYRYKESLEILGGCRIVVTPLSSKLVTIGAGLACFEMRPSQPEAHFGIAIPYAEVTRYSADIRVLHASKPTLSCLVLTGDAYDPSMGGVRLAD